LLAAFFALECFVSELRNCEILLRLDNTTAIAYINKAGGVQLPHLSELARKIWKWCESRSLWIVASYIPSATNVEADRASRITNIDTEWELNKESYKRIVQIFGPFSIDLFASKANRKCRRFAPDILTRRSQQWMLLRYRGRRRSFMLFLLSYCFHELYKK